MKLKAGECKHLVQVFEVLARELNTGSEYDQKMETMFSNISKFCNLMGMAGMFPAPSQAKQALDSMAGFLQRYEALKTLEPDENMWHVVSKHHMAGHLAESFKFMNPKYNWCFKTEDLVGKISVLAHSCTFGTKNTKVSVKLMQKYRHLVHIKRGREIEE